MKEEIKDIGTELAARTAPAGVITMVSSPWWVSVNWVGVLTGVLVVIQIAYLLRKWYREETTWGLAMRRWLAKRDLTPSRAMELDE